MVRLRRIEFGVITEINPDGHGYIKCERGDYVQFSHKNVCCALPGTKEEGRPVLQPLNTPVMPTRGLAVAFLAGQRAPVAEAYCWCPICSYDAASDEMENLQKVFQPKPANVATPFTQTRATHGQKVVARGPTGRPLTPLTPIEELGRAMDRKTA